MQKPVQGPFDSKTKLQCRNCLFRVERPFGSKPEDPVPKLCFLANWPLEAKMKLQCKPSFLDKRPVGSKTKAPVTVFGHPFGSHCVVNCLSRLVQRLPDGPGHSPYHQLQASQIRFGGESSTVIAFQAVARRESSASFPSSRLRWPFGHSNPWDHLTTTGHISIADDQSPHRPHKCDLPAYTSPYLYSTSSSSSEMSTMTVPSRRRCNRVAGRRFVFAHGPSMKARTWLKNPRLREASQLKQRSSTTEASRSNSVGSAPAARQGHRHPWFRPLQAAKRAQQKRRS